MRMKTQILTEIDGRVVNESEFNQKARGWGLMIKSRMRQNIANGANSKQSSGKLKESIKCSFGSQHSVLNRIGFQFERYGVFRAYGVGRGYVNSPYGLIRGYRTAYYYKKHRKNKSQFVAYGTGGINRTPLDWFDTEIVDNIDKLADIVAEFYGDKLLVNREKLNNYLINK